MVGISAGSGQLINYLGKVGAKSKVHAAASLCPAYDISNAFQGVDKNYPSLSAYLTRCLQETFLDGNEDMLVGHHGRDLFNKAKRVTTMSEFVDLHVSFAGHSTKEEYHKHSNPMEVLHRVDL